MFLLLLEANESGVLAFLNNTTINGVERVSELSKWASEFGEKIQHILTLYHIIACAMWNSTIPNEELKALRTLISHPCLLAVTFSVMAFTMLTNIVLKKYPNDSDNNAREVERDLIPEEDSL